MKGNSEKSMNPTTPQSTLLLWP